MKIVFLCGSLEEGRDGVGDYTRKLAMEMVKNGHQATAIALFDVHIATKFVGFQELDGHQLMVLRIPSKCGARERFAYAQSWINEESPKWISLQYVPFSFHKRGLHWHLSDFLLALGTGRSWHIMFHELWVGMEKSSPLKLIFWGWAQQLLIKSLVTSLKPQVIHTQSRLYQLQLLSMGFKARVLPLFSNIGSLCRKLTGKMPDTKGLSRKLTMVFFGSIYPDALAKDFSREVAEYQQIHNIEITLKFIGRCGPEQQRWAKHWQLNGLKTEILGELPAQNISEELSKADIGLTTTPLALVEKSGTVAAMWQHGLPVISVAKPWLARGGVKSELPEGVVEYKAGNLINCLSSTINKVLANNVIDVASQLEEDLFGSSVTTIENV